ncbi:hydroxyacylglutathione hydrolase [Acanthopleuribacter pedis]|uniref:Hydroxyacylglutathione hydrolase n=1 Tax=Acanthopleuribacter pedis TaxID=442870 RepID=A0A8J7U105_9BACT|nr:hydroxyacylglutathione hydrolase [Acanthopleuribacter pedis]
MEIVTVPCLRDNFAYLIICPETRQAGVVDPSEADPVLAAVEKAGVTLTAILTTHHHWDHVGGNKKLVQTFPDLVVYGFGADRDRIPKQTVFLEEGDAVRIGNLVGSISHNPGHTTGAITYYFGDAAFTGDTLFAAGCGRLFEGDAADMKRSLNDVIGSRPATTRLFFGHEYTASNLAFALSVEPDNTAVQEKLAWARECGDKGVFTTPSTVADEWATNPFMRLDSPAIHATVKREEPDNDLSPVSVLRVLRAMKDNF